MFEGMKKQWSEMNAKEKKLVIALAVYVLVALVFAGLDLAGVWRNIVWHIMVVLFSTVEGVFNWKKNKRALAIVDFLFAAVILSEALFMHHTL